MEELGELGVVANLLNQIDLVVLLIIGQALIFCVAFVYFRSLKRSAQDAALFALPQRRTLERSRLGQMALKFIIPENALPEHVDGRLDLTSFDVGEMATNSVVRGSLWARGAKRGVDIFVSMALGFFTLPLTLVVVCLIKMESTGPVIYRQVRVGRHGKLFQVYKFRSMTVNAEQNGVQWAGQEDARVTSIGKFIRKARIDEIPQVINIFIGDMSFVGPRPERPEFTKMLATEISHYDQRHRVKPGLTGWAQVNYPYGASVEDAREKLQYDLYYLKHFSFILDVFIIIKTLKVAVKGIGSR